MRRFCFVLALVLALGFGCAQAEAVKSIGLNRASATIYLNGSLSLKVDKVKPASLSQVKVTWHSSDSRVATVDQSGVVTPVALGNARIYARAEDGSGVKGACQVKVTRVYRRALVVGCGKGNRKLGTVPLKSIAGEVEGVARALSTNRLDGGYPINLSSKLNITKKALAQAIQRKFADAKEADVSYLYLTGHGYREGGEYYMVPCTDRPVSARELRAMLDEVRGTVVLIINACYSGSVIGKAVPDDIAKGFARQFMSEPQGKATTITGSKYIVLTSTKANALSWTYLDKNTLKYVDVFGTPFAAGVGWDYMTGERALLADANGDWQVTHRELLAYLSAEVRRYAQQGGITDFQTVGAYPAGGSDKVLFAQQ